MKMGAGKPPKCYLHFSLNKLKLFKILVTIIAINIQVVSFTPRSRMGGAEVKLQSFLTSAVNGGEWSDSRPDLLTCEHPGYPFNTRLVGPERRSKDLDKRKKYFSARNRNPNRPGSVISIQTEALTSQYIEL